MAKIIEINESENVLSFCAEEEPIVANCSNYFMKFNLSEDWLSCSVVTAVFSMAGVKHFVELDSEHQCKIPPATSGRVVLWLRAATSETETITSTVLALQVTPSGNPDFNEEPVYVNAHRELLGVVESLKHGDIVAKKALTAETSESQVSLTGDQTVSGVKNFVDGVKSNGECIITEPQAFNKNLLLNPDFRVNQRAAASYTSGYTVDRWQIPTGTENTTIEPTLNGGLHILCSEQADVLQYRFEEKDIACFAGKTLTLSMKCSNIEYGSIEAMAVDETNSIELSSHENALTSAGLFKLTFTLPNELSSLFRIVLHCSEATSANIEYVKLEYGTLSTEHRPRLFAQELFDCQRYYVALKKGIWMFVGYVTAKGSTCNVTIQFKNNIRTTPTLTINDVGVLICNGAEKTLANIKIRVNSFNDYDLIVVSVSYPLAPLQPGLWGKFDVTFDAEIY